MRTSKDLFAMKLAFAVAVLLAYPHPLAAQSVGPSGCVAYCSSGGGGSRSGGGGGNPYGGAAAGVLGDFMNGFMREMQRQNDPRHRSTALNNQGVAAANQGDNLLAIRYYEAALRDNPSNHTARKNLSTALNNHGYDLEMKQDYIGAESYYQQAVAKDPNSRIARDNLRRNRRYAREQRRLNSARRRVSANMASLENTLNTQDTSGGDLSFLDSEEPDPLPVRGLGKAKERIDARLDEVKEKILNAPPGKSAWDGGYGGTLDSPEAAGVGAQAVRTDVPRYEEAAPATASGPLTADSGGGLDSAASDQNVPQSTQIQVPSDLRDQVASLPGREIPTLKPEKGPAVLDKNTNYNAVKAGVMEWVATGQKPKLNKRIPEPVYPPKSRKAEVLLDSLEHGKGDWDKSRKYLEDLQKKNPKQAHIQAAIDDLNSARAAAYWKRVEDVNKGTKPSPPFDAKTRDLIEKGRLMAERGDWLLARKFYMQAYLKRTDSKALGDSLNEVHHKLLEEAKVLQEKARLNIRAGKYGKAREQLLAAWLRKPVDKSLREQLLAVGRNDIATKLHPGNKPVFEKGAEKILQQGFDYRHKKQYGQALDAFRKAAKLDPGNRMIRDNYYYTKGVHEARQRARGVEVLSQPNKEPYDAARDLMFRSRPPKPLDEQTRQLTNRALQAIEKGDFNGALANLREAEIRRSDIPGIRDIRLQTEGAYHSQLWTD